MHRMYLICEPIIGIRLSEIHGEMVEQLQLMMMCEYVKPSKAAVLLI